MGDKTDHLVEVELKNAPVEGQISFNSTPNTPSGIWPFFPSKTPSISR